MEKLPHDILGQTRPLALLKSYLINDTIPHALLFLGPDGVGKKTAARYFAMALNCLNPPPADNHSEKRNFDHGNIHEFCCGECRPCRLLAEDKHPDFLHLAPEGAFIKVDQIRRLIEALSLKPVEARTRVVLIENVQYMNPAAANALLKTLEEPFPATEFILTAPTAVEVMPTILSRCQRINFQPLTAGIIQTLLQDTASGTQNWEHIAYLSGGGLNRARALVNPETMNRRKWLLNEMAALPKATPARLLSLANELNKTKSFSDFDFNVILSWFRDAIALKISGTAIINRDFMAELQYNNNLYTLKALNERTTLLQNTITNLTSGNNTNPRLTLEHLLLALR